MSDDGGDVGECICREARHTVDHHIDRIHKVDQKAVGIFRVNLLLIGILLTSLTIVINVDDVSIGPFFNIWSFGSLFFLVLSTFFASITYTSSEYDLGISPELIEDFQNGQYGSAEDFHEELADLYKEWMVHNRTMGRFNAYLITISIAAAFNGIVLLLGGGFIGITEYDSDAFINLSFFGALFVLLLLNWAIWAADGLYSRLSS